MPYSRSKLITFLTIVYLLIAIAGTYISIKGYNEEPLHLEKISKNVQREKLLVQAKKIKEIAEDQTPLNPVLEMFYKGWLLKYDYKDLIKYKKPLYKGDSFEKRIAGFNQSVSLIFIIYKDAVTALAILSIGGLILTFLMLLSPGYLISSFLLIFPAVVVVICSLSGINYDPLEYCWIPFIAFSVLIFILQLRASFKYGNHLEHSSPGGRLSLTFYRQGLIFFNIGLFVSVGALIMLSQSYSGAGSLHRTNLLGLLIGEEGVAFLAMGVGVLLIIFGIYSFYISSKKIKDIYITR